jgi:hypothetical protein
LRITVAEILRQSGYTTAWVGKNHNTPVWETSEIGPFDRWANGVGFDYFLGFDAGDTSQYERRGLYCSRLVYGLRASTMLYPLPNTNTFDVRQMIRSRSTMVRMRSRNFHNNRC